MAHQPVLLAITTYLLNYHEIGEQLSPCPPLDIPKWMARVRKGKIMRHGKCEKEIEKMVAFIREIRNLNCMRKTAK